MPDSTRLEQLQSRNASTLGWAVVQLVLGVLLLLVTEPKPWMHGVSIGPCVLLALAGWNVAAWWRGRQ